MSAEIIQAEYEILELIVKRFALLAETANGLQSNLYNTADALYSGGWEGVGFDSFSREMDDVVHPTLERLFTSQEEASYAVSEIIQILTNAEEEGKSQFSITGEHGLTNGQDAAVSKNESSAYKTTDSDYIEKLDSFIIDSNPSTLFNLISHDTKNNPIKVIQVNENEFMILVAGTAQDLSLDGLKPTSEQWELSHDWVSNIGSAIGFSTDYQDDVMEQIRQVQADNPNSKIHLAGHSQGGIIVDNIASNEEFTDTNGIETVTTFGAPNYRKPNEVVEYMHFQNIADPIHMLDGDLDLSFGPIKTNQELNVNVTSFYDSENSIMDVVDNHTNSYGSNDNLNDNSLAFEVEDQYYRDIRSVGSYNDGVTLNDVSDSVISVVEDANDFVVDAAVTTGDVIDEVSDVVTDFTVDAAVSAGDAIDHASDAVVDKAVDATVAVGDAIDDAGEAIGDMAESTKDAVGDGYNKVTDILFGEDDNTL